MAVASDSTSKRNISDQKKKKKFEGGRKETSFQKESETGCHSPGVGVIHGRIYDPENGKACHQCRHKIKNFAVVCKNKEQNKLCSMAFCRTCLLNRYGEKAEEMDALEDWSCPRCRGICNCSRCMKKRGHQPTGAFVRTAKATGFSSTSELQHVKGCEYFGHEKIVKDIGSSPKEMAASTKESLIALPRKRGKENSFDGKIDSNLHPLPLAPKPVEEKPKKMKREGFKDMHNGKEDNGALSKETSPRTDEKKLRKMKQEGLHEMHNSNRDDGALLKEASSHPDNQKTKKRKREESKEMHGGDRADGALLKEASPKKPRHSSEIYDKEVKTNLKVDSVLQVEKNSKTRFLKEVCSDPLRNEKRKEDREKATHNDVEVLDRRNNHNEAQHKMVVESHKINRNALESQNKDLEADRLPKGTELTTVAGIDLPLEDVGNALQFLEFCAAFGKILNMNKGQPESVLRELIHGRSGSRGKYSSVVQFHIQLLSLIKIDMGSVSPTLSPTYGKDSWLHALKNCISESQCVLDSLPLDCLDRRAGGYDALDFSLRLRLLNFLCDEVLGTGKIRNWIDDQNSKLSEKAKKAKEKVLAAKDKEKRLRQKMQDEVAKAIIAKNGAPLSISEHEAIVSQIKSEVAQAHAEMLESKAMVPQKKEIIDAVRAEPILLDINGCAYWRLKSCSDKADILFQDIRPRCAVASGEKWFAYDIEQEKVIEKHISLRERKLRLQKVTEIVPSKRSEANA